MLNEEIIQNVKIEVNSLIAQKKNQISHKVQELTKIKFVLVEHEIVFLFQDKDKENIIYYDTEKIKVEGNLELLKHSIFLLDNELRTLFFIKNTLSDKKEKSKEIDKSVI